MRRLIACLLFLFAAVPAVTGTTVAQEDACADVTAYLTRVDATIDEGLASLDAQPGFRDAFASATETNAASGSGFLALSTEQQTALIAYLRMPGEALARMDKDDIPADAQPLHDSAVEYWTMLPDMMQTIADESPSAAIPYFEDLDAASLENLEAQKSLTAACPKEVAAWADAYARLDTTEPGTPQADLMTVWEQHAPDDMTGLGYTVLFFATEEDPSDAPPAASTLAISRVIA